ncbi:MAG: dihydrodipicolinate synthase family protein [Planctomycetes bacterium]|nr:dihydrodipicolinate synthase family protein [Planctomycetota bacterium]
MPPVASSPPLDPASLVRPRRAIIGMSAILLPMRADRAVDWDGFAAHVARTSAAGITPAINMDTGYVQLIDDASRRQALRLARDVVGPGGELVAGACVVDEPGAAFDEAGYGRQIEIIRAADATPVIFPSFGLTSGGDAAMLSGYRALARRMPAFIGFELGTAFVPCGRMLSLDAYAELMQIPTCLGAKHSSLSRRLEWQRLVLRDRVRPDFKVFTGNDLAIDMVRYGSDWLLGLSTAAPAAFAQRDRWWAAADSRFDELDDALQALGDFAFRPPVPAYKHTMAQALHLQGLIATDEPHPHSPRRPASDREIVATILARIDAALHAPEQAG